MIHIKRSRENPDIKIYTLKKYLSLDGVTKLTKAEQETEEACAFFSNPANFKDNKKITKKKEPDFSVYKDEDLAAELKECFHSKCAYCESKYAHVSPEDIEHFRPKGKITTENGSLVPGYYWLAADWNNLLISCNLCNRTKYLDYLGQTKKVKGGKYMQFPLTCPESQRVRSHLQDIESEDQYRLIMNPCIDFPEDYLTYDEKGIVSAKADAPSVARAQNTIDGFALWRKDLVEEREGLLIDIKFKVNQLKYLVHLQAGFQADDADANKVKIEDSLKHIALLMKPKKPYLGMLCEYILKSKASGDFEILESFGIHLEDLVSR